MRRALFTVLSLTLAGCSGTTGSGLVAFTARAGGPADGNGTTLEFDTGFVPSYHVSLTSASMHIGAVYLNMSTVSSGGPQTVCELPGIYVGQAFGTCDGPGGICGVDIQNLLSSDLTTFGLPGQGTANQAVEAEVWLSGGDINDLSISPVIFSAQGTATGNGIQRPFSTTITIGANRKIPPPNVAEPGANPICGKRIVSPIPLNPPLVLSDGGTLDLRIDPRGMFNAVDFSQLPPDPAKPGSYLIPDDTSNVGNNFFNGLAAVSGYGFTFTAKQ